MTQQVASRRLTWRRRLQHLAIAVVHASLSACAPKRPGADPRRRQPVITAPLFA
ncbi:MAG: hypothetical protein R2932_52580 [Caldilineaceae bacterium]